MEQRETIASTNQLTAVLDEMRKPNSDVGRLGELLFDLSAALIPQQLSVIEHDREAWRRQTKGGSIQTGLFGEVEIYQIAFSTLASLGRPGKPTDYVFYLQDNGLSRLAFARDEQGQIVVEVTANSLAGVKEKFRQLSGGTERLQLPAPSASSGLLGKLRGLWRRED